MQTKTITIGTALLSVAYPDGASEFGTPNALLCSYADSGMVIENDTQTPTLNWQGMPISVTQFLDPTVDDSTGDVIGNFFALDVIRNTTPGLATYDLDEPGIAKHATWNGNKILISLIDNKYYLNVINIGTTAVPYNKITFQGTPQATGESDELILNDSGFTIDDIDTDPNTGNIDIKSISLGGVPISIGRVGFKYYLIVKPILNPIETPIDLTFDTISQYKMNDNLATTNVVNEFGTDGTNLVNTDTKDVTGKINGALTFDGIGDYVDTNISHLPMFINSFSINVWIKAVDAAPSTSENIYGTISGPGANVCEIYLDGSNLEFDYRADAGVNANQVVSSGFSDDTWYMITVTMEEVTPGSLARVRMYIDSSEVKDSGNLSILMNNFASTHPIYIGARDGNTAPSRYFNGDIDNFCLFDKVLDQDDIDFLYSNGEGTEELSN